MPPIRHTIRLLTLLLLLPLQLFAADQPADQHPSFLKPSAGVSLLPPSQEQSLPQPPAAIRIGVFDLNRVSMETVLGKSAQTEIKALQTKLQKQIEVKRKRLDKLKADTESALPNLNPAQREAKAKEFQKRVQEFQKFGMQAEKELMASQEKQTRTLLDTISQAAVALGKLQNLAAIVIHKELLYLGAGVSRIDLTQDLIKLVDEKTAKK